MPINDSIPCEEDLESLRARMHDDLELISEKVGYPCIITENDLFGRFVSEYESGSLVVNVDLDILRDGLGNVFVNVKFSTNDVNESFLIDAVKHMWFFETLADSTIVGIRAKNVDGKIFAVQLPKPDAAKEALEKIRDGIKMNKN
ncbi:MAG: hypothetical protein K8823_514 [Cenarchaeum symbiont of Oopsacas minuta]|nr:hypothetical protein [Cenarchaeum symbiont of Oopsacas minuta]